MISKIDSYKNEMVKIQNPFQQNVEQKVYNDMGDVYFAFIDVLGFKYMYERLQVSTQGQGDIENDPGIKFKKVFSYYFQIMNKLRFISEDADTYAGQTSDSLYFYTKKIEFLFGFINVFTLFNQYAMSQDVFFRGGIAQGKLFMKAKHQFYGDSVIKAYLLESVVAQNPVIYVDHKTANDIYHFSEKNGICSKQESIIYEDVNNQRYYLKPFYKPHFEDYIEYLSETIDFKPVAFADIQEILKKNKIIFEYHPKTFCKYTFLEKELKKATENTKTC